MKTIIVDDEVFCTDVLSIMITKYCPQLHIIGVFNNAEEALQAIEEKQPDLVFIDIEMPLLNGFELIKKCNEINFKIIFTTAYDQYALKAFKFNTIDYLLKPIDKEELVLAVGKAVKQDALLIEKINFTQYLNKTTMPDRIMIPIGQELIFILVKDIIYCEAEGSYCNIFTIQENKPYLVSRTLKDIEEVLQNPDFIRCHSSFLINKFYIHKINKNEGMEIYMKGGRAIPVARSKKQEVIMLVQKL